MKPECVDCGNELEQYCEVCEKRHETYRLALRPWKVSCNITTFDSVELPIVDVGYADHILGVESPPQFKRLANVLLELLPGVDDYWSEQNPNIIKRAKTILKEVGYDT